MSYLSGTKDVLVFMVKDRPAFLTAGPAPFAFIACDFFLIYTHILHVLNRIKLSNMAECF